MGTRTAVAIASTRAALLAHPRTVLACSLAVLVVAAVVAAPIVGELQPFSSDDPGSQSVAARQAIERATGADPYFTVIALVRTPSGVDSPAGRSAVAAAARSLAADPGVATVHSYESDHDPAMVALDRRSTYVVGVLRAGAVTSELATARRLERRLSSMSAVRVGGLAAFYAEGNDTARQDLIRAELLAFPLLLLIALWVFRGVVAASLPLLVGAVTIVGTLAVLRIAGEFTNVSIYALNITTALGLGLAVDYSLLIVYRYREEMARTGPGTVALQRTLAGAGRTVAISSVTIAGVLASLLVFPQPFLRSIGLGAILVSLIAGASALVILPAILSVLGSRVNSLSLPRWRRAADARARPSTQSLWYRGSRLVMRHPLIIAVVSATALLALASPVLGLRITQVDWNVLPSSTPARSVHDTIRRDFPATNNSPVLLAVHTPPNADVAGPLAVYAARLRALPGVDAVRGPTRLSPRVAQLEVVPSDPPLSSASETLVRRIRALASPFGVLAGGETASLVDLKHSLAARLPLALAIVILVTLIAVFLLTRSVVLAVKALLMSSLTIAAVLGALVLVFQNGALEGLLGYTSSHALEPSTLVLIFAMSFGLATDYGIFLLSRIKELRDRGASDRQAVADGVERTGPVVTAAALLLCVALGSLISADHALVKEVGFGAALAVAIDATIVRGLLLPSLMCLLGKWNWWAPRLLRAPAPAGAYAPAPAGGQPPAPAGAHAAAVPAPAAAAGHAAGASAEILEPAGAAPARNGGGAVARVARRSPSDPSPAGSADALALTPFCDHDHPSIREAMAEIKRRAGAGDEEEWAVAAFEFVRDEVLYTLGEWGVPASRTLAERGGTCTNKANLLVALLRAAGIPAAYGVMRVNAREYFGVLGPPFLTRFCSEESVHIYAGAFLSGRWVKCDASTDSELAGRTAHFCRQTVLVEWDGRRDSLDFLDERHVHADLGLFANIDELLQRPARAATPQLWAMGNAYIDFIRAQPPFESDAALMAAYRDSLAGERPRTSSEIFVVGVD